MKIVLVGRPNPTQIGAAALTFQLVGAEVDHVVHAGDPASVPLWRDAIVIATWTDSGDHGHEHHQGSAGHPQLCIAPAGTTAAMDYYGVPKAGGATS